MSLVTCRGEFSKARGEESMCTRRKSDGPGGRGQAHNLPLQIMAIVHACDYRIEKFWARIKTFAVRAYQLDFRFMVLEPKVQVAVGVVMIPQPFTRGGRLVDLAWAEELRVDVRVLALCDVRRNK